MTLTDLRWRIAFALACPACWLDEWIESRLAPPWAETWTDGEPGMRNLLLYIARPVPLRYRILRKLIVDPLTWLSEAIYPGWAEDERARLDYWGGR